MSALCLCLTAPNCRVALEQLNRYPVQMAELRVDLLRPEERRKAAKLPSKVSIPLILTVRRKEDGGHWAGSEDERQELLTALLDSGGWAYADLEHGCSAERPESAAKAAGTRVIRSVHDFNAALSDQPPEALTELVRRMSDGGIPKLAVHCKSSRHLLTLTQAAADLEDTAPKVILGMGEYGQPSRILAQRFGSAWTYVSENSIAAPGQVDPESIEALYRFSRIDSQTSVFAVTGNPVAHSQSPKIHNSWIRQSDLNAVYIPVRSDDMPSLLETCDLLGLTGLSVTIPHKEEALRVSVDPDPLPRRIGAANTLLKIPGGWKAFNTDAEGFMRSLTAAMGLKNRSELAGMRVLQIGAGGAAKAAAHALSNAKVKLTILNRSTDKARRLAEETGSEWGPLAAGPLPRADILVQTTSVGMSDDADPVPWWNPDGCRLVYDMIYEPAETALLRRARLAGVPVMNGAAMLRAQAALQFEIFTGKAVPEDPLNC